MNIVVHIKIVKALSYVWISVLLCRHTYLWKLIYCSIIIVRTVTDWVVWVECVISWIAASLHVLQYSCVACTVRVWLSDVTVTGAWGRIDDSVTAGELGAGARCMQPSIAAENTRQRIIMKYYIPRVFVKQDNKKCRSVVNELKFRKLGSCYIVSFCLICRPMSTAVLRLPPVTLPSQ